MYPPHSSSSFVPSASALLALDKADKAEKKVREAFNKQAKVGEGLAGTGSGKVHISLPTNARQGP